jgi:hypothetical protein
MAYGPTIGVRQLGALIALLQLHPVDYEKQIHALHLSISAYDAKEAAAETTALQSNQAGFDAVIDRFRFYGFSIDVAQCDHESTLLACRPTFARKEVQLCPSPPDQHAQLVESHIRTLGRTMRAMLASMNSYLPAKLLHYAWAHAAAVCNLLPEPNGIPAYSAFTGKRFPAPLEQLLPFGQVVMTPATEADSSLQCPGIFLGFVPTESHCGYVYVESGDIYVRPLKKLTAIDSNNPFGWPPRTCNLRPGTP